MQCPKCGHQSDQQIEICPFCGFAFTGLNEAIPKPKTSKMAIVSFILGISSLSLLFIIAVIPSLLTGILGLRKIRKSNGKLKGRALAVAGITTSTFLILGGILFFLFWRVDAPPIPDDYTIADFRSAPADCAASYELLKTLVNQFADPESEIEIFTKLINKIEGDTGKKVVFDSSGINLDQSSEPNMSEIVLSKEDVDTIDEIIKVISSSNNSEISKVIEKNREVIEQAWIKAEKSRDLIRQLNEFPEIADLTEPYLNVKPLIYFNLMRLYQLYQAYIYININDKNTHNATPLLIQLDSIFRKLSINIRNLAGKLICYEFFKMSIKTANDIANNPETPVESIAQLLEHYKLFTDEQLSMRNSFLDSYLLMKDSVDEVQKQTANIKIPFLKRNSTLRMFWNHWHGLIISFEKRNAPTERKLTVWPKYYPFKEPEPLLNFYDKLTFIYRYYNPLGSSILETVAFHTYEYLPSEIQTLKTQLELLRIVLNMRLGREIVSAEYPDAASYTIDLDNKCISVPVPDEIDTTKDEIMLPINPEVLGLQ